MAFTVMQLDNLKPKEKVYEVREGKGFGVRIYPSGTKKFFCSYHLRGRNRHIGIGEYPTISLSKARRAFNDYYQKIKNDIDPLDELAAINTAPTIKQLSEEFIQKHSKPKKATWKEDERILERYVINKIGNKKARDVTRREIKSLVDNIATTAPIQANRVLACIRKMFNYAIEVETLDHSPCVGISQPGGKEHSKTRYLNDNEIEILLHALDNSTLSNTTQMGLKLILLTGQRPGEVCGMHSSEIEKQWWTIPATRSKNGKDHKVFLNKFALDLIKDISGFILPSTSNKLEDSIAGQGISTTTLSHAVRSCLEDWGIPKFTPHDLRRTCGSHLVSLGFSQHLVGLILNHTDQSITSVYNQYSYDKEKQQAMEAWEQKIEQIINSD